MSACGLTVSVSCTMVIAAKWDRAGRTTEKQFMLPLYARGTVADVLPHVIQGVESYMSDLVNQCEAAAASAERGYTYKFPRLSMLHDPSANDAPKITIPEVTAEQRQAVAAMLADTTLTDPRRHLP